MGGGTRSGHVDGALCPPHPIYRRIQQGYPRMLHFYAPRARVVFAVQKNAVFAHCRRTLRAPHPHRTDVYFAAPGHCIIHLFRTHASYVHQYPIRHPLRQPIPTQIILLCYLCLSYYLFNNFRFYYPPLNVAAAFVLRSNACCELTAELTTYA